MDQALALRWVKKTLSVDALLNRDSNRIWLVPDQNQVKIYILLFDIAVACVRNLAHTTSSV